MKRQSYEEFELLWLSSQPAAYIFLSYRPAVDSLPFSSFVDQANIVFEH